VESNELHDGFARPWKRGLRLPSCVTVGATVDDESVVRRHHYVEEEEEGDSNQDKRDRRKWTLSERQGMRKHRPKAHKSVMELMRSRVTACTRAI
jgi:hypothetical protein